MGRELKLRKIGRLLFRLEEAKKRGFALIPSSVVEKDEDRLRLGAHVNGMKCFYVQCEKCGRRYMLKSYACMLNHRMRCG